jgi:phenylalanyl-tRNA synthetase beta chain
LHPGRAATVLIDGVPAGYLGELHPGLLQKYDLPFAPIAFEINLDKLSDRKLARFDDFSRQPMVRRDVAVEIAESVSVAAMLAALKKAASALVCDLAPFDVYRGKGIDSDKKSVAFRVLLQDTSRTLTDAEVDKEIGRLVQTLQEEFQARLRK